jgi:hypothetical protein
MAMRRAGAWAAGWRPAVRWGLGAGLAVALLGVAPIPGRAQGTPASSPAPASSAGFQEGEDIGGGHKLLVDALLAKHHRRADQQPLWGVATAGCLDHLLEARGHETEAREEAEKVRAGQHAPDAVDRINAAIARRHAAIDRYDACVKGAPRLAEAAPARDLVSPPLAAKLERFVEVAVAKALESLTRSLEGRRTGTPGGSGAGGPSASSGDRLPPDIPREHLPLYYHDRERPDPLLEFAQGLSKGWATAEEEDLPYHLSPQQLIARRLKSFQRLAGVVGAVSTGNSLADLLGQLQRIDPGAPKFDLGYRAARILRQGTHLRDVAGRYGQPRRVAAAGPPAAPGSGTSGGVRRGPSSVGTDSGGPPRAAAGATSGAPAGIVLGPEVGHGSFGRVYRIEGQPDRVIKLPWSGLANPLTARASVTRQRQGHDLVAQANADRARPAAKDPIPVVAVHEAHPGGHPPYLVMEHATEAPRWKARGAYLKAEGESLTDGERQAMRELADKLARNGLVWTDPNAGNVSFFRENGTLKAAIIDHDFLYTATRAEALARSMRQRLTTLPDPNDPAAINAALGTEQKVMFSKLTSSAPSLLWLDAYLKGGPFRAREFMAAMGAAHGHR